MKKINVKIESLDPVAVPVKSENMSIDLPDGYNRLILYVGECLYRIDEKGFIIERLVPHEHAVVDYNKVIKTDPVMISENFKRPDLKTEHIKSDVEETVDVYKKAYLNLYSDVSNMLLENREKNNCPSVLLMKWDNIRVKNDKIIEDDK
jgi:hypothetical protein